MSLFNSSFNHLRRQFDALLHDVGPLNPNRFRNTGKFIKNRSKFGPIISNQNQVQSRSQGEGGGSNTSSIPISKSINEPSSHVSTTTSPAPPAVSRRHRYRPFNRRSFFDDDFEEDLISPFSMSSPFNQFLNDLNNYYVPTTTTMEPLPDIKVDFHKEKDKYVIKAEMPGIEKDNVNIEIENGYLTISGEKRSEKEEEDKNKKKYTVKEHMVNLKDRLNYPMMLNKIKLMLNMIMEY